MKKYSLLILMLLLTTTAECSTAEKKESPVETPTLTWTPAEESEEDGKKVLEDKILEQKERIASLEGLVEEYSAYLNTALEKLDEKDQLEMAQSNFRYELSVNGEPVPKDSVVRIPRGTFKIKISEALLTSIPFPPTMPEGSLPGVTYADHLVFVGQEKPEAVLYDGTMVTAFEYTFEEGYAFDMLEINITKELQERLDLDTSIVKIILE